MPIPKSVEASCQQYDKKIYFESENNNYFSWNITTTADNVSTFLDHITDLLLTKLEMDGAFPEHGLTILRKVKEELPEAISGTRGLVQEASEPKREKGGIDRTLAGIIIDRLEPDLPEIRMTYHDLRFGPTKDTNENFQYTGHVSFPFEEDLERISFKLTLKPTPHATKDYVRKMESVASTLNKELTRGGFEILPLAERVGGPYPPIIKFYSDKKNNIFIWEVRPNVQVNRRSDKFFENYFSVFTTELERAWEHLREDKFVRKEEEDYRTVFGKSGLVQLTNFDSSYLGELQKNHDKSSTAIEKMTPRDVNEGGATYFSVTKNQALTLYDVSLFQKVLQKDLLDLFEDLKGLHGVQPKTILGGIFKRFTISLIPGLYKTVILSPIFLTKGLDNLQEKLKKECESIDGKENNPIYKLKEFHDPFATDDKLIRATKNELWNKFIVEFVEAVNKKLVEQKMDVCPIKRNDMHA